MLQKALTIKLAPVLLFCFKRLTVLKQTVDALQNNFLAEDTELFVFSDGAKNLDDVEEIQEVRSFLKTIKGFRSVEIFEAPTNVGLAGSIIKGVTKMFQAYDKVIVLEDDLLTSRNFLSFMNQALNYYQEMNVFSVSGFSFPIAGAPLDSVYFTTRSSSWGWATWKDRWQNIDWQVEDYEKLKGSPKIRRSFNRMGSDLAGMLDRQMEGKIDSWAIRWCYHQFKQQSFTVFPVLSKVQNNGFGAGATHTKEIPGRYKTYLDLSGNTKFSFRSDLKLEPRIVKQFTKHYSVRYRIYFKLLNLFRKYMDKKLRVFPIRQRNNFKV